MNQDLMRKKHLCLVCGKDNASITSMGLSSTGTTTETKCPDCGAIGKTSNAAPWKGRELTEEMVRNIFGTASIPILAMKKLRNGYWGDLPDGAHPWWFVKTANGWIEIGWRKRVISIDWSDTPVRTAVTTDEVTKDDSSVHAYSEAYAAQYLTILGASLAASP